MKPTEDKPKYVQLELFDANFDFSNYRKLTARELTKIFAEMCCHSAEDPLILVSKEKV